MGNNVWINFIENIIGHIAWPVFILITLLIFRKPITVLISRIESASFGSLNIGFAERVSVLNEKLITVSEQQNISTNIEQCDIETVKIADSSSVAAIIYAYSKLETFMREKIKTILPSVKIYAANNMPKLLLDQKLINKEVYNIIVEMRKIRNETGRELLDMDKNSVIAYSNNIQVLINIINQERKIA